MIYESHEDNQSSHGCIDIILFDIQGQINYLSLQKVHLFGNWNRFVRLIVFIFRIFYIFYHFYLTY